MMNCDSIPVSSRYGAAFDTARANQHEEAVAILDKAIDAEAEGQVKAWLLSRKAAFLHPIDAYGAQKSLAAAHGMEPGRHEADAWHHIQKAHASDRKADRRTDHQSRYVVHGPNGHEAVCNRALQRFAIQPRNVQ